MLSNSGALKSTFFFFFANLDSLNFRIKNIHHYAKNEIKTIIQILVQKGGIMKKLLESLGLFLLFVALWVSGSLMFVGLMWSVNYLSIETVLVSVIAMFLVASSITKGIALSDTGE